MKNQKSILILILIAILIIFAYLLKPRDAAAPLENIPVGDTKYEADKSEVKDTYTYTNHGFSIELPKGFVPKETESEGGPSIIISMSDNSALVYVTDSLFWEKSNILHFKYLGEEKIGETTFKVYDYNNKTFYWYKKGNVGYEFHGNKKQLETFKFVGWPQVEGNKDDLLSFSIKPGDEVSGYTKVTGEIKGAYFFEGNILLNLLDSDKKMMRPGHANATTDWMTSGPVSFTGDIDFTGMYRGKAYIEIMADDPSDHAAGPDAKSKNILIPIVIK